MTPPPFNPLIKGRDTRLNAEKKRPLYIKRAKVVVFFVILFSYLAFLYFGTSVVLPSQENDANTIARMSTSVDEIDSFDGYAAMAYIYAFTNSIARYALMICFSSLFFYQMVKWSKGAITLSISAFLCASPILLFLCFFMKDTFYLPFMLASLWVMTNIRSNISAPIITFALISLYAFLFRQYFLIVAAMFVSLYIFRRLNWTTRIIIILTIPFILLAIPKELYVTLQEQRDIVNQYRIGFSGAGTRTAFLNYMRPDDAYSFLINYGYAFIRLNFPLLFGAGVKEIFLMANVFAYGILAWVALRSNDARVWRPATLFLAHFLTLLLFEPDLGSYLRHIGTSLPLLAPALGTLAFFANREQRPSKRARQKPPRAVLAGRH